MFASNRKIEELEKRVESLEKQNQEIVNQLNKVKEYSKYYNPFDIFSMAQPMDADPQDARDMGLG